MTSIMGTADTVTYMYYKVSASFPNTHSGLGMGQDKPVIVGTSSHGVMAKVLLCGFLCPKVFQGVGPQEVTHRAKCRRFFEAVQLLVYREERGETRGGKKGEGGRRGE